MDNYYYNFESAMFKIGEFSKIGRVTVKALRHYDELGLLKPVSVDEFTGYRFYTAGQLPLLQHIVCLKQAGLSLADIAAVVDVHADREEMIRRLEAKKREISKEVDENRRELKKLTDYIEALGKEKAMDYHVVIKELPAVTVASMRRVIKNYGEYNSFYPEMGELMREQKLTCATPDYCFTLYHDSEYKAENIDVEICQAVVKAGKDEKGMVFKTVPAVQAATVLHRGPYRTIGKAYASLTKWVEDNGYEFSGLIRESYIDGIWNQTDENRWLTELQVPIRK